MRPKLERCGLRSAIERAQVEACDCCAPLVSTYDIPAVHATWKDTKLVVGAAIFGLGWGVGGICPGPGMVSLTVPTPPPPRTSVPH